MFRLVSCQLRSILKTECISFADKTTICMARKILACVHTVSFCHSFQMYNLFIFLMHHNIILSCK